MTAELYFIWRLQCPQVGVLKPLLLPIIKERSGWIISVVSLFLLYCWWIPRHALTAQVWTSHPPGVNLFILRRVKREGYGCLLVRGCCSSAQTINLREFSGLILIFPGRIWWYFYRKSLQKGENYSMSDTPYGFPLSC